MSLLGKVIAAVTPSESEESRGEIRLKARAAAGNGDWLSMVLDQHVQVESAVAAVLGAADRDARLAAHKWLATLLIGHANAEETVIYPSLAALSPRTHSAPGYAEHAAMKIELGLLETVDPMSAYYLERLERIKRSLQHHMYAEEGNWYLDLKQRLPAVEESRLTKRFKEEFERYCP